MPCVRGFRPVDAVELGRVPDGLVHLHDRLLRREDDRRAAGRARGCAQERRRLLADARRLAVEPELLDVLPAALAADARVLARIAPHLGHVVGGCVRVDPAAALVDVLLDVRALGGDEDLVLALGADHRDRHLHVVVPHAVLGPQAEVDLLGQRDGEGVALERRAVLAGVSLDGREVRLVPAGRCAGELDGSKRCVSSTGLVEPSGSCESPGAVHEHADTDARALGVAQVVDLAVLRDHVLAPHRHGPSVRVGRPSPQCRVDRRFGERSHASNPNPMGSDPFTTPSRPGRSVTRPVDEKCAIRSRSARVSSRGLTP